MGSSQHTPHHTPGKAAACGGRKPCSVNSPSPLHFFISIGLPRWIALTSWDTPTNGTMTIQSEQVFVGMSTARLEARSFNWSLGDENDELLQRLHRSRRGLPGPSGRAPAAIRSLALGGGDTVCDDERFSLHLHLR